MHLSLKQGVKCFGIRPEMVLCAMIVASVYSEFNNASCVITSITDGTHGTHSHHYKGFAMDFRTRHVPVGVRQKIADRIQAALGAEFQVRLESNHIHVEFDPER
jgi:hypothetical protein